MEKQEIEEIRRATVDLQVHRIQGVVRNSFKPRGKKPFCTLQLDLGFGYVNLFFDARDTRLLETIIDKAYEIINELNKE